ncbi:MAG: hypothetical protein ACOXZ9_00030 [Bacteroidales bacterium]
MFLTYPELRSVAYGYQLQEITDNQQILQKWLLLQLSRKMISYLNSEQSATLA